MIICDRAADFLWPGASFGVCALNTLPTLEDVARRARVSTATVSRVLNNSNVVSAATRERVEAAIGELGYTPHFGGRALASNRTNTVGVIIPTMENAIFATGLQALQEEFAHVGVTLLVATSHYDPERELEQLNVLLARGVDGVVLIGEARAPETYGLLERRRVPFVLVWTWRPDCPWKCVGFDNRAAARAMAERVLDFGHQRIAMLAGVTRGNDRAQSRVEGVQDALKARGLSLAPDGLVEAVYTVEAGADATEKLMSAAQKPTAIICGNDVLAAGAILAIRDLGLSVPQDVSVVGFDDIELAKLLTPPLTTVHVPHRRMGESAGRLLYRLIEGESDIPTDLIERESLGPVAAG